MENHYKVLGLNNSATPEEIRRAYRVLARRYHPDVNPGKQSEDRFKSIADAYRVLSDPESKRLYDIELENEIKTRPGAAFRAYESAQRAHIRRRFDQAKFDQFGKVRPEAEPKRRPQAPPPPEPQRSKVGQAAKRAVDELWRLVSERKRPSGRDAKPRISRISVVEVSVSIADAIHGVRKTIEINEPEGMRKVSVTIPPGVRNGSVVHLRSRRETGEDLVLIMRVAAHPFISIQPRGLIVEIPITVQEAISGASITVPSLDDPVVIRIPAGTQSGAEIRVRERGIAHRDGARGDLFYRALVQVPEASGAIGLREKAEQLEQYYGSSVRSKLPKSLLG